MKTVVNLMEDQKQTRQTGSTFSVLWTLARSSQSVGLYGVGSKVLYGLKLELVSPALLLTEMQYLWPQARTHAHTWLLCCPFCSDKMLPSGPICSRPLGCTAVNKLCTCIIAKYFTKIDFQTLFRSEVWYSALLKVKTFSEGSRARWITLITFCLINCPLNYRYKSSKTTATTDHMTVIKIKVWQVRCYLPTPIILYTELNPGLSENPLQTTNVCCTFLILAFFKGELVTFEVLQGQFDGQCHRQVMPNDMHFFIVLTKPTLFQFFKGKQLQEPFDFTYLHAGRERRSFVLGCGCGEVCLCSISFYEEPEPYVLLVFSLNHIALSGGGIT